MWGREGRGGEGQNIRIHPEVFSFLTLCLSAWEGAWDIPAPCFSGFGPVLREIRLELNQVRHFISVALVNVQVAGGYSSKGGGRGLNKEAGGVQSSSFSLAVPAGVLLSIAGLPD